MSVARGRCFGVLCIEGNSLGLAASPARESKNCQTPCSQPQVKVGRHWWLVPTLAFLREVEISGKVKAL